MAVITHEQVRRRLLGIKYYLDAIDADDLDAVFDDHIAAATARFERELGCCIERKVIVQDPDPGAVKGVDYDILEPALNWNRQGMDDLITLTMRRRPIISVERIRLKLAQGVQLITFPPEWYADHQQFNLGIVTLVPVALGDMALSSTGVPIYQWVTGRMPWPVIPQMLYVNYTAGWADAEDDPDLADLRVMLSSEAALRALRDIRRMVPSGASLDGASQQFGDVQKELEDRKAEIDEFIAEWRARYNPPNLVVI